MYMILWIIAFIILIFGGAVLLIAQFFKEEKEPLFADKANKIACVALFIALSFILIGILVW